MKQNIFSIVLIIMLVITLLFSAVTNSRVNRLQRQLNIESAKTSFTMNRCCNDVETYDSVRVNKDTVMFYNKGTYMGMSVITTE